MHNDGPPRLEVENRMWSGKTRLIVGSVGAVLITAGLLSAGPVRWIALAVGATLIGRSAINRALPRLFARDRGAPTLVN